MKWFWHILAACAMFLIITEIGYLIQEAHPLTDPVCALVVASLLSFVTSVWMSQQD